MDGHRCRTRRDRGSSLSPSASFLNRFCSPARAERRRSHGGGLMRSFDWLSVPQGSGAHRPLVRERAAVALGPQSPGPLELRRRRRFDSDHCRLPGNSVARTRRQLLPCFGPAVLSGRSGQGPPRARTPANRLSNRRSAAGRGVGRRDRASPRRRSPSSSSGPDRWTIFGICRPVRACLNLPTTESSASSRGRRGFSSR